MNSILSPIYLFVNGMQDRDIPPEVPIAMFGEVFGDRPVVDLPNVGDFLQEDDLVTLIALIQNFVQST